MPANAERYNVIALFDDERRAKAALDKLDMAGVRRAQVRLLHPSGKGNGDRIAQMRDEVVKAPRVGFPTADRAKGALYGSLGGTIIGAIAGFIFGFVWMALATTADPIVRIVLVTIVFAIAGAVTGGVMKPRVEAADRPVEMDENHPAAERDTLVAVHVTDIGVARRAKRLLADAGAERVDAVNEDGRPLPQSERPRPADPPRWWRKGARG